MTTHELITVQENKDRALLKEIYSTKFTFTDLLLLDTDILCHYDLHCLGINKKGKFILWNTEIKQLNGNYDIHILKTDKLNRMLNATPEGIGLYYAVINPDSKKLYLYNCKKIDWTKVGVMPLYLWKCNTDHSKGKATYNMYRIKKELALYVIDLTEELLKPFINANN